MDQEFKSISLNEFEPLFSSIREKYSNEKEVLLFSGCSAGFDSLLICDIFKNHNKTMLVVVPDYKYAEQTQFTIQSLLGNDTCILFPSRDAIPYNLKSPFGPTVEKRLLALTYLMQKKPRIIITTPATLLQRIESQKKLFNRIIRLHTNDEISQEQLIQWLIENNFNRETTVKEIGSFAVRGCILDVYPFLTENPIRIEFFGDTIETIREFDIFKQNSVTMRSVVEIVPMKEILIKKQDIESGIDHLKIFCTSKNLNENNLEKLIHRWTNLSEHDGIEWFLHWFNPPTTSILDHLPSDSIIVWNDMIDPMVRLQEQLQNYKRHLLQAPISVQPFFSEPEQLLFPIESVCKDLQIFSQFYINTQFTEKSCNKPDIVHIQLNQQPQPAMQSNIPLIVSHFIEQKKSGFSCMIVCQNKGHAERLQENLSEESSDIPIYLGFLDYGFIDRNSKFSVYSESQLFKQTRQKDYGIKKSRQGIAIASLDALDKGDYVVHVDHGIGRFIGIERINTNDIQQDCMVLEYLNKSMLYVPVDDFHKVQKYIGKDSAAPLLSKLGNERWEKLKEKARQSLKVMAEKLIALAAKRQYLEGISFSADTIWQKEFEDAFLYEPTPDQITAISEVKKDMESAKPMDRLICGDVGFGKTEVAMRAAFKAAMDGYQVAILAPTTILAAQHYATFKLRMADFTISIGILSRFQTSKEQAETCQQLKEGNIQIIIGTHRLLSQDIQFKKLGLLIIDEEQRFGVTHKEKLKEYRYMVDVISMSATPIPRTLHMSLAGIRDLSIINTPPSNRLPIETQVMEYHDEILKNAIENEMERGGQVYIVENRIRRLPEYKEKIELAVPHARVAIAHGQMEEDSLSLIMQEFIAGRYDVLLATTIIENGLDIPNVNTMIVMDSDHLGLSQLYQLRGRVGRSSEQAYTYFLVHSFKQVTENSMKRLRALEQFTDLGSGFQIAMRDLEIRGAGNILGSDQHGTIASIGFELYCTLLKEEVEKLTNTSSQKQINICTVEIPISAFIPSEYVPDSETRIALYRECSRCSDNEDIIRLEKNFLDQFGPIPESVSSLILLIKIKILGESLNITKINLGLHNVLTLTFKQESDTLKDCLKKITKDQTHHLEILNGPPVSIKTTIHGFSKIQRALDVYNFLNFMNKDQ